MDCGSLILSENTYDFIVEQDETEMPLVAPICVQPIDGQYEVWYFDKSMVPPISVNAYSYTSIPKCFYLTDSTSMEVSGITALQNSPTLSLKGQGVFVGIIDTGIDYTNKLFQNVDGTTRIFSIWDQTAMAEELNRNYENNERDTSPFYMPPDEFLYGVEYKQERINQALAFDNPNQIVPQNDTIGHGTYLASLVAGNASPENDFLGAAPESELLIVKLKPAKQNIKDYFYISDETPVFQENDIMAGVRYLESVADRENRPLVILLGLGSNQGSRSGSGPLSVCCNTVGAQIGRTIVISAGNEADKRHHYSGKTGTLLEPVRIEVNVEEDIPGFCMELWAFAPELVRVVVQSPTGQKSEGRFPLFAETQTTRFLFENTLLNLDYRIAGRSTGDVVAFFRFTNVTRGIWTLLVYPENTFSGNFHVWLPIRGQLEPNITFIAPNPDTTITEPSAARIPITVGGYNGVTDAFYLESGRGYDSIGMIKPDFVAPAIMVKGAGLRNNFVTSTGNSVAAAITAGACIQVLQWAIVNQNAPNLNSVGVKNILIRGCRREQNRDYPNRELGFGKLDVYQSFENLR